MKTLSEKQALTKIRKLKNDFRAYIRQNYEHRAKDCRMCETRGLCCLDEHFVNVRITQLEAVLIAEELQKLPLERRKEIYKKISETVDFYNLDSNADATEKTFACPLFDKKIGCLIHEVKPVPCIQHACYERREDLPPDELQTEIELKIEKLNEQTYRKFSQLLPLPVWLKIVQTKRNNRT